VTLPRADPDAVRRYAARLRLLSEQFENVSARAARASILEGTDAPFATEFRQRSQEQRVQVTRLRGRIHGMADELDRTASLLEDTQRRAGQPPNSAGTQTGHRR
jgi:hypothetical protein